MSRSHKRDPWGWVPEWQAELFVEELAQHGDVKRACKNLGITRSYTYWERQNNPEFADMCEEALAACAEDAEAALVRLATTGSTRIESVDGETGSRRTREDANVKAIELLLRARMPKLYGKKVEQTVVDGGPKKLYDTVKPEDM